MAGRGEQIVDILWTIGQGGKTVREGTCGHKFLAAHFAARWLGSTL